MEIIKFDEMKKTWFQIARHQDGNIPPSFELEVYKKLLNIFHMGDYYYYIVNTAQVKMEMVSDQVMQIMEVSCPEEFTVEYIYENIHPQDKLYFISNEKKVADFFNSLPPAKVPKYKVSYDYRLKTVSGQYKWILMQSSIIQSDEKGAVLRVLGVQTDITHLKTENKPAGLSLIGMDGEPSFYNILEEEPLLGSVERIFTRREKNILKLVLEGKNAAAIANLLYISTHTVRTHRKNILNKSGCRSLAELWSKAMQKGWIGELYTFS